MRSPLAAAIAIHLMANWKIAPLAVSPALRAMKALPFLFFIRALIRVTLAWNQTLSYDVRVAASEGSVCSHVELTLGDSIRLSKPSQGRWVVFRFLSTNIRGALPTVNGKHICELMHSMNSITTVRMILKERLWER